jgi:hypothetical protein
LVGLVRRAIATPEYRAYAVYASKVLQDVLGSGGEVIQDAVSEIVRERDRRVQSDSSKGLDMVRTEIIAPQARTILLLVKSNVEKDAEIARVRAALEIEDRRKK